MPQKTNLARPMLLITARLVFPGMGCARAFLLILLLIPTMSRTVVGAETVGWKIPLEFITSLQSPGVVRLESPPEKSPLFGDKDELWDVSKAVSDPLDPNKTIVHMTHPPMEWVVWNASTGRLVTKSDWRGIWQIHEMLGVDRQTRQYRYQLALYDSQDGRSMPQQDAKPLISLSSLCRSGINSQSDGEMGKIQIEGELVAVDSRPWIDVSLSWSAELPGGDGMRSKATFTSRSGKPMVIAGDVRDGAGLVAVFTATTELVDGTPYEDVAWQVKEGKVERLGLERTKTQRVRVGERWLLSTWVSWRDMREIVEPDDANDPFEDPFAETPPAPKLPTSLKLLTIPESLREWFSEEAWDIHDVIVKSGISIEAEDLVGYDPKRQEIFFYSASLAELDKMEQLFELGCIRGPTTISLALDAIHPMFLVSRSGQLATLERISGQAVVKSVQFEPTIAVNDFLIDTQVEYQSVSSQETHKLETAVTVKSGSPLVIHQPPGEGKPWVLTAEIHRGHE